jgi:magnesium/cobalt transport protein CorA
MIKKQNYQAVTWVDSESPTKDEARSIMEEFQLSPEIAQDILLPTFKDRIISSKDYIYLVLHFPAFKHTHNKSHRQEIDFVIGKKFIITNRYESIDAMEKYAKIFEVNSILDKKTKEVDSGRLFLAIMRTIYQSLSDELDSINYLLNEAERKIFAGKEREMVFELSKVGREIINFNHIIIPHGNILETLKQDAHKILSSAFALELDEIINEYYKVAKNLENVTQVLQELRETNNSLLSTKQNEIMKTLTIFTFFALPFTIITGFFQMNTKYTPIVNNDNGWLVIIGIEIMVMFIVFMIAKKKKWF